jgi:hypothetical protein
VVLVDASSGIVKVVRPVTWSPQFVGTVRDSILKQLSQPHAPDAAAAECKHLYGLYTPKRLAEERSVATCIIRSRAGVD